MQQFQDKYAKRDFSKKNNGRRFLMRQNMHWQWWDYLGKAKKIGNSNIVFVTK